MQDRGFGRGAGQAGEEAVAGQHGGVDAVVLGEPTDGFGEAPGAQRVDRDGSRPGVEQALVQLAVVAPGGFEDGAGDAVLDQPVAQSTAAGLGVGEVTGLAARFEPNLHRTVTGLLHVIRGGVNTISPFSELFVTGWQLSAPAVSTAIELEKMRR